jgi:hypothetical protein
LALKSDHQTCEKHSKAETAKEPAQSEELKPSPVYSRPETVQEPILLSSDHSRPQTVQNKAITPPSNDSRPETVAVKRNVMAEHSDDIPQKNPPKVKKKRQQRVVDAAVV